MIRTWLFVKSSTKGEGRVDRYTAPLSWQCGICLSSLTTRRRPCPPLPPAPLSSSPAPYPKPEERNMHSGLHSFTLARKELTVLIFFSSLPTPVGRFVTVSSRRGGLRINYRPGLRNEAVKNDFGSRGVRCVVRPPYLWKRLWYCLHGQPCFQDVISCPSKHIILWHVVLHRCRTRRTLVKRTFTAAINSPLILGPSWKQCPHFPLFSKVMA